MPAHADRDGLGVASGVRVRDDVMSAHEQHEPMLVLAVATACLALHTAMNGGYLANPLLGVVSTATLVCFLLVPMATLALLGHDPFAPLLPGRWRRIWPHALLGLAAILGSAFAMAHLTSFRQAYGISVGWQLALATLVGMFCLEYFFRGFLLLPLFERIGWWAAVLAAIPYALVHVGKPTAELVASVPFALYLSYLAVRSGSILYGVALHWVLAIMLNFWVAAGR